MFLTKSIIVSLGISTLLLAFSTGCTPKNINIIGKNRVEITKHKGVQEGNFMKIMAELENDDNDETEGFVYQIEWYDKNGFIKDETPWKAITIHKNQKIQVIEMTNIPDIVDYKIIVSVPNK
ncbi:MAG: hypothetical protein QG558_426 [Campylobacterota bacterium]|nr:hypothetical protein [Campylobacterota bacterium]